MNSKVIENNDKKHTRWWYSASIIIVVSLLASLITTMIILNKKVKRDENSKTQSIRNNSIDTPTQDGRFVDELKEKKLYDHSVTTRDITPDPTKITSIDDIVYWGKVMARNAKIQHLFTDCTFKMIGNRTPAFNWSTPWNTADVNYQLASLLVPDTTTSFTIESDTISMETGAISQLQNNLLWRTFGMNVLFNNQNSIGLRSTAPTSEFTYKKSLESIILRFGVKTEIRSINLAAAAKTGSWSNTTAGVSVLSSSIQNSALTFTFAEPSTTIVVVLIVAQTVTGSTCDIFVDDVLNTSVTNDMRTTVNPTFIVYSIPLRNLSNTNHVIKVVKTGTGTLYVFSCFTHNSVTSHTIICKEYYLLPAGYAKFTIPPTNADVDRYNGYIDQLVASFPSEAQTKIGVVEFNSRWNPTVHLSSNALAPNDLGISILTDMILDKIGETEIRPGSHIVRTDYTGNLPSLTTNQNFWLNKAKRNFKIFRSWAFSYFKSYGHEFTIRDTSKTYFLTSLPQYILTQSKLNVPTLSTSGAINDTMEDSAMNMNGGSGSFSKGSVGFITLMSNQYNVCTKSHLPNAPNSFKKSLEFFIAKTAAREVNTATITPKKSGTWQTMTLRNAGDRTNTFQLSNQERSSIEFDFETASTAMAVTLFGTIDNNGSEYEIYVDDELKNSGNTSSQSVLGNRADWATAPGAPIVVLIRNLPKKKHSVKVVKIGSTGTLHVDSAFVYIPEEAPYLVIMKDTYCLPSGYSRFTISNPTNATVDEYNDYIDDVVALFPERSNNIAVLDPNGSGWDPQIHILSDRDNGQMPNDLGVRFLGELVLDNIASIGLERGSHFFK